MLEVAGGILLAILLIALIPLLRSMAVAFALAPVLLIGAFFLFTEFGRGLLPIALAVGYFAALFYGLNQYLDWRDERKRRQPT